MCPKLYSFNFLSYIFAEEQCFLSERLGKKLFFYLGRPLSTAQSHKEILD